MTRLIFALAVGITVATGAAVAQDVSPERRGVRLEGTIGQYDFVSPSAPAPVPDVFQSQPGTGDTTDPRWSSPSPSASTPSANSASGTTRQKRPGPLVPYSTYGGDSCVHGHPMPQCPYNSTGGSYGSMYLSGRANVRTRSDRLGGYRYYSANGEYGSARPLYTGGYRVTTASGSSYRTTSVSPW